LISGNSGNGITLASPAAQNNRIRQHIGAESLAPMPCPIHVRGIFLTNGAALNLIGGTIANSPTSSRSTRCGVRWMFRRLGNSILGNSISGNVDWALTLALPGDRE